MYTNTILQSGVNVDADVGSMSSSIELNYFEIRLFFYTQISTANPDNFDLEIF